MTYIHVGRVIEITPERLTVELWPDMNDPEAEPLKPDYAVGIQVVGRPVYATGRTEEGNPTYDLSDPVNK